VLQIFRSVVDDPVGRAAPAPADIIIDRPSSIVAPNQNLRTNPLKRNGDVDQQPQRRPGGSSRSLCVRARWNRRAPRARAWGQRFRLTRVPLIGEGEPPMKRLLEAARERWHLQFHFHPTFPV
jgi:hypothetical protein